MPNFGQYVFQPRPLQQFDIGQGFRDVIQAYQNREAAGRQDRQFKQNRGDSQAEFSANYAKDRNNVQYDQSKGRYDKQSELILKARAAAQAGHHDAARALIPQILEYGGQAEERPDGTFFFKGGDAPARAPVDIGGARRDIYGGSPPGGNPFTPPALPGASAAQLPPQPLSGPATNQGPAPAGALPSPSGTQSSPAPEDAAGPPPGAAIDGPRKPPPGAVWLPPGAEAASAGTTPPGAGAPQTQSPPPANPSTDAAGAPQAPQPGSPQSTGPNPFRPPGLDPYTIDPARVREQNKARLDPFLGGLANAAGSRFKGRIEDINRHVASLGLPPDESLKVTQQLYSEIFGLARGEMAAEGQAGRLEQMGRHRESVEADKDRDRGFRRAKEYANLDNLKETKKKLETSRGVQDLLKVAHRNGTAANALIRQLYKMYADGVMTDKDYVQTKEGVRTLWQAVKDGAIEKLFNPHGGGLSPDIVKNMRELVDIALRGHQRAAGVARDSLYRAYKGTKNEYEREAIGETLRAVLPEEYYPPEFTQGYAGGGADVPTYDPQQTGNFDVESPTEDLGTAPIPRSLDGAPSMPREPNRTGAPRGSRVSPKPDRKQVKAAPQWRGKDPSQMTAEEMKEAAAELKRKAEEQ